MNKRLLTTLAGLALVAGTVGFGTSGPASAAIPDCNGRELNTRVTGFGGSDITAGDTDFVPIGDGYDITFNITLASTSCTDATYGATLYDAETGEVIGTASAPGDGLSPGDGLNEIVSVGPIHASAAQATFTTTTGGVLTCVNASATTSNGGKVLDSAPDSGTIPFCDPDSGGLKFG